MPRITCCVSTYFVLLTTLLSYRVSLAQTTIINNMDGGWYSMQGIHDPTNSNYLVGDNRPSCVPSESCQNDFRNFFVFDLGGVTQPIASGTFTVFVPRAPDGYQSPDPSENYELHDVVTPIATLVNGTGGVAAWNDLGTGVVYGSRSMTAADMGKTVEITLNSSAIAALNSTHGLFAIGGSITTLDQLPNWEEVFGASGGTGASNVGSAKLRLTLVPEPSTLLLLAIGATSVFSSRRFGRTEAICSRS